MKRIISAGLCMALAISMAGCTKGASPAQTTPAQAADTQMGRWVESSIDLGGEQLLSYPTQLADGTLVLYTGKVVEDGVDSYTRRTSTDGENWTAEPVEFDVGDAMVTRILVAPDGEQAVVTYDGENAGLVLQAADGTQMPVEDAAVQQGINPNMALFSGDEFDFISQGDALEFVQVSLTDGSVTTTALPQSLADLSALKVVGDQFVYLSFDPNNGSIILNALDPMAGTTTELLNPLPNATSASALTGDADGAAYYACTDGIYRLAPGGTLPEQIVPAEGTAMSISSNYPLSLLRTAEGDFMVLLFGDGGGSGDLYFYHYDETLPTHADTTLTVWSLADSATARLAVNAYKKANPEVDVTFETAVQTDTDDVSAAINDALTQLNTELLAGEGPDVLLLDRVDYTTYINKGMLADMSDTVPLDALQSNIIDPFVTDGKAYVLPARFIVPALCGDAGTLDGLTDLDTLQDAVLAAAPRPDTEQYSDEYYTALPDDQKYALALSSGVDFAQLLLPSSANALLRDGALDADALTKVFTFVKTTADYYGMADYTHTEMDGASSQSYDNADIVIIDSQQDEYSTCSRAKFGWMDVATPYAVIAMARTGDIFDADAEAVPVDMIPMPGLTQGAYNPQVLVGVNANSKNPDAAKGLAAAFFGTDVQSQYCSDGTTVRADCLQEKLNAVKATVSGAKTGKVTGAYVGDLDAFYANCTTPVWIPVMLQQSFINHAQAIIDGSEDVAAAVAGVQSDLALYLAEQK